MERLVKLLKRINVGVGVGALLVAAAIPLIFADKVMAQGEAPAAQAVASAPETTHSLDQPQLTAEGHARIRCWAFLAAALATGIGSLGAGYAVGPVGAAALGAVAEKPELMGKSLIYVALAEGIAIYGLLISIIVLSKV